MLVAFNNLLRVVYKNFPLPLVIKQWLERYHLNRSFHFKQSDLRNVNPLQCNHEGEAPVSRTRGGQPRGSDKRRVLVVDLQVPMPDRDSGSVRMAAIIRLLAEMDFRVTFICHSGEWLTPYEEALKSQGVDILYGFDKARRHLEDEGRKYHFILLSRPSVTFQYLLYARTVAPYAIIIYDTVDLHWIRCEREMGFL